MVAKGAAVAGGLGLGVAAGAGASDAAEEAGSALVNGLAGAVPNPGTFAVGFLIVLVVVIVLMLVYFLVKRSK